MSGGANEELVRLARDAVVGRLCERYGVEPEEITEHRPFAELGLTSADAVALASELSLLTGEPLAPTLLWDHPTPARLGERLRRGGTRARQAQGPRGAGESGQLRNGVAPAAELSGPPGEGEGVPRLPAVAVVGAGCRLPGADGPEEFWRLLSEGRDAVGLVPEGRWDAFLPEAPGQEGDVPHGVSPHGGYLADVAGFDAEFFGIPPREAAVMDPQQRMLLEVAREALDHAALPAPSLAGTATGVFVGISGNEYAQLTTAEPDAVDAWTPPGAALSIAANRLSYALDLRGPSMALDTACSSSLVAVHHAVRALGTGECDTALAGGANLLLSPALTLAFQRMGALSPNGRCRAFDASADGMVRGEGCAVLVLKRLADAERDGDRVLAVLRSTAVNSDGRSNGLLAPNPQAQREVLARACAAAGVRAEDVDHVEAHGTGTPLGDPIEAEALGTVLGAGRAADRPLLTGSVKSNLGHLEAAAGIVGLLKTVLALHHDEIPPSLHFQQPSPYIDFDALRLRVAADPEPWPRYSGTATAGVSAFGFGGTNAHAVLQEHRRPPASRPDPARGAPAVLLLDAATGPRLRAYAGELGAWLETPRGRAVHPYDLGRTLAGRTGRGRHRAALTVRDTGEAARALTALAEGRPDVCVQVAEGETEPPGPVWVFSGYGSQWAGMGERLLDAEPAFAEAVDRLEPVLREHAGLSLREHLRAGAVLEGPDVVMPVLFGMQVALAELWRAYGCVPSAVIGHSLGEVAAAVVAGALDLADGARVVGLRSRLLARQSGGAMAAVELTSAEVERLSARFPSVELAVHASPAQTVVTGTDAEVAALVEQVTVRGGLARALPVGVAGHSPHVDPLLGELREGLAGLAPRTPSVPPYGTVLEDPRERPAYDAAYWAANLRRPVRFAQAVTAAAEDGHRAFVEVSPHPTQLHPLAETWEAARAAGAAEGEALLVPTLRRGTDDAHTFRTGLAALLAHGLPPRGAALHPGGRVADVPGARWWHRPHWTAGRVRGGGSAQVEGLPHPVAEEPCDPPAPDATSVLARLTEGVGRVLGFPPGQLAPDAPLTDFGLDSLMAARIRTFAEREFGVAVPPAVLLRRGTLEGVAEWVEGGGGGSEADPGVRSGVGAEVGPGVRRPLTDPGADSGARSGAARSGGGPVRVLAEGGAGAPLFLAHPAGGGPAVYSALAERLGAGRTCYGLERVDEPSSVAERARVCARLVRETCPDGPWVLGGWSYGGLLAQEAARVLVAEGGRVSALLLIDSVLPLPAPELPPREEARRRFAAFAAYVEDTYGVPLPLPYGELALLDDAGQVELVVKALEQAVGPPHSALEHQRTSYLDLRSGERHTPGPYAGRTLLVRATEAAPHTVRDARYEREDEALGWDAYCSDLAVVPVHGHHLSLLDPPAVDLLARHVGGFLAESEE
ncbi:beta-ketoacyl synthase N-terminal-like domain-containing protein [Streptomyces sp. ODS28]|uniref:beta-ketoacyl synthase N-terminal-like domain-containing protein n=1 Tax=Streptomyces sp. ODS28 TaxID=3136688 RepID=UPI0031EFB122